MTVRRLLLPAILGCAVLGLAAPTSATPPSTSLVGVWERETHCQDYVRALTDAGFGEATLNAASEFVHVTPPGVADEEHPCRGALPRRHSHFFTPDGQFGSLDEFGNQVDEGTYEIVGPNALVIPYGFEEGPPILVTFHYRIRGNTIVFDPVIPTDCSTSRCREAAAWSITVALPGKTWRRVG